MGKFKKIALRTLLVFALGVIYLVLVALLLLKMPAVQKYIADKVAIAASEKLSTKVKIGQIHLQPLSKSAYLSQFLMLDQKNDTLFYFQGLTVKFGEIDWQHDKYAVKQISLNKPEFYIKKSNHEWNFGFLEKWLKTSPTKDTTITQFNLKHAIVSNGKLYLNQGQGKPLQVKAFDAIVHQLNVMGDHIFFKLENLSLKANKILQLNNAKAIVDIDRNTILLHNLMFNTIGSKGKLTLSIDRKSLNDLAQGENLIDVSYLKLAPIEISSYVELPKVLQNNIEFQGKLTGNLSQFKGRNIIAKQAGLWEYVGGFNLKGLPVLEETLIDLKASHLYLASGSLLPTLYPNLNKDFKRYPAFIRFKGSYFGFLNDFVASGNIETDLGNAFTDLNFKYNNGIPNYEGKLITERFNLGYLFNNSDLGYFDFDGKIKGKGKKLKELYAELSGDVLSFDYNKYTYKNIHVDGTINNQVFKGQLLSKDKNAELTFEGTVDLSNEVPQYAFDAQVEKLDLNALNLSKDSIALSGVFEVNAQGNTIDNLIGRGNLHDFELIKDGKKLFFDEITFSSNLSLNNQKALNIQSDLFDIQVLGAFNFTSLPISFKQVLLKYLPTNFENNVTAIAPQDVTFKVNVKSPNELLPFFIADPFRITPITLEGHFNSVTKSIKTNLAIESLSYRGLNADHLALEIFTANRHLAANGTISKIFTNDTVLCQNIVFANRLINDSLTFDLSLNGADQYNNIDLTGVFEVQGPVRTLKFGTSNFNIIGNNWILDTTASIDFTQEGIAFKNIYFNHSDQQIGLQGLYDLLYDHHNANLGFVNFDLEQLNPVLSLYKTNLEGILNGQTTVVSVNDVIRISSDLNIDQFVLDGDPIADIKCDLKWDNETNRLSLKAIGLKDVDTLGSIFGTILSQEPYPIAALINLNKTTISPLNKLLEPNLTNFSGYATTELKMTGTLSKPYLVGKAYVENGRFKVDLLNTFYNFADSIHFTENYIDFNNIVVSDNEGGKGVLNGKILHDFFRNTRLDLNLKANNLHVLNTNAKSGYRYYGSAYASGFCDIKGHISKILFDIGAKSEAGTNLNILLNSTETITSADFIHFINKDTAKLALEEKPLELEGVDLQLSLDLNNDANINIIFDQVAGDVIKGKGSGLLKLKYDIQENFTMDGTYTINQGDYLFTYENLINKRFKIQDGSTITWSGDPYDAQINLIAMYRLRTNLRNLLNQDLLASGTLPGYDTNQVKNMRYPVDVVLKMNGKMLLPTIGFEIKLPNFNANNTSDPIVVQLNTINNNEQELNKQVFSLMAINDFAASNSTLGSASTLQGGISNSVSELFSNQVSNWISQYSGNVNIGINYRDQNLLGVNRNANNAGSGRDISVALSTTLLNNRLVIDGNLGTNYLATQNSQAGQGLGADVSIDYKITPDGRVRLGAYNKLDDRMIFLRESNYRQGIKLSYKRDFNQFGELFTNLKQKARNKIKSIKNQGK